MYKVGTSNFILFIIYAFKQFRNPINYVHRYRCALRELTSVKWVLKHIVNEALLSMQTSRRFFPDFDKPADVTWELYQVRVSGTYNILRLRLIYTLSAK